MLVGNFKHGEKTTPKSVISTFFQTFCPKKVSLFYRPLGQQGGTVPPDRYSGVSDLRPRTAEGRDRPWSLGIFSGPVGPVGLVRKNPRVKLYHSEIGLICLENDVKSDCFFEQLVVVVCF